MFSKRSPTDLEPTPWARLLGDLQARRVPLVDLTLSNPTQANIEYPADLLAPLAGEAALRYEPSPLGLPAAREAISSEYARRGVQVPPDQILLTASTSEAYSFLFKLLCDPGDQVLVPVPSYPLFEHLTRLDAVRSLPYPLEYHGRWSVDVPAVARAISDRARALLLVSPNNPTGSFVSDGELGALADLCAARDLAIVGDEVFADYVFEGASGGSSVLSQDRALAFALGGLSVGVVPLLLAPTVTAMAPVALLAGVAISPTLIASFGLVEELVPVAVRTEGFTWLNSGLGAGVAAGSAVGGALADGPGARTAFAVSVAGALLALATAVAGRRTLRAPVPR